MLFFAVAVATIITAPEREIFECQQRSDVSIGY
jgi:hypothetical protein